MAAAFLGLGYAAGAPATRALTADGPTALQARLYLYAFLPSLAALFPTGAFSSALRACGVVMPPMLLQSATVALNAVLAPILITGWLTGHPLGVAGAGVASSISTVAGVVLFALLFARWQDRLRLEPSSMRLRPAIWSRIIRVGAPSSGEMLLIFVVTATVSVCIRGFGAQAQAGFGIASRGMQSIFLPAMAVAFACAPIAGQNYGAGEIERVRGTFANAAVISSLLMLALTLLCQIRPEVLVAPFSSDPTVIAVAAGYLRIASWNFVAVGLVFTCSGMFQALGDTRPSLLSAGSRLLTFVLPAVWLSSRPFASLQDFWLLSVASVGLQAVVSLTLLRRQMRRRLAPARLEAVPA